jgi:polysaccharide deacetylase family protein (PEP-CTERM system associated)
MILLDVLREHRVHATVFVVGEVAQRHPRLIEEIVAQGHELGCHSMSHRPLWEVTPDEFRAELEQFACLMHDLVPGVEIVGFRAPTFSLDNRTRWALGILTEFGYHYDSSIFPLRNPMYGVNGCPLLPYRPFTQDVAISDPAGSMVEFPMSVWAWDGLRLPVSGGFYVRALPFTLVRYCLRHINRTRPFVIYVHPWEAYSGTPRLALPWLSRFVTYYHIGTMLSRLQALCDEFPFAPMRTVLEERGDLPRIS